MNEYCASIEITSPTLGCITGLCIFFANNECLQNITFESVAFGILNNSFETRVIDLHVDFIKKQLKNIHLYFTFV